MRIMRLRTLRYREISRGLIADRQGLALTEFALALPLVIAIGCWGTELALLARTNLQLSQYALNLADTSSRVGIDAGAGVTNLRETDVNDILQGIKLQGASLELTKYGRVTLSSLEYTKQAYDSALTQRIHWQRCIGLKSGSGYDSSYGTTKITDGTTDSSSNAGTLTPNGMGETSSKVNAAPNSGTMFVEVNYEYRPLFGTLFVNPQILRYVGSYMVRDNRNYQQLFNPAPAAERMTCDRHTS